MTESTTHVARTTRIQMAPSVHYQLPGYHPDSDHSTSGEMSRFIDQLIEPTWAEMEDARDQYNLDAKRLRYWRWWFVGMFTFYTTLVGILLLKLLIGS